MDRDTLKQFAQLSERYIKAMFEFSPNRGSAAGLHEYDLQQPELGGARIQSRIQELRGFHRELDALPEGELPREQAFDLELLQSAIDGEIFQWEAEQECRRNPMWYTRALDITPFLTRNYAPLADRVRAAIGYLLAAPRVLDAARENLLPNLPRPFLTVSVDAFRGMLSFYDNDLEATAAQLQDRALHDELERARGMARSAVSDFLRELEERYLPAATDEFAIGAANFERMLRAGEMVDLSLEALLAVGERDLNRNLEAAHEVARQINPEYGPREAAEALEHEHPTAEQLIPATRALLEQIRQFLIDHQIVTVPSEVRALVEPTPGFLRWAFAMMDTPGPFEERAREAYYYITPPDPSWPTEQQEEWLTIFNPHTLQDITVHEAYPGHYVHFLHVNHTARGKLRKLLYSYAFSEGWAHYAEEMMIDAGFGNGDPRLHLAQILEALLRDCRYICSLKLHAQGMSVDEATRYFMEHAFMEEKPARQEALRGTFDPGYLNYTLGKLMILKLRKDVEVREGINFNLLRFHDQLLSYGAPPVPLVRQAILGQGDLAIL